MKFYNRELSFYDPYGLDGPTAPYSASKDAEDRFDAIETVIWWAQIGTDVDGHIGFIAETNLGVFGVVNYCGMNIAIPKQLHSEDTMRLMVEEIRKLKGEG